MSVGKGSLLRAAGVQAAGHKTGKSEEHTAAGHRLQEPEERAKQQTTGHRSQEPEERTERQAVERTKKRVSGKSVKQTAGGRMTGQILPDRKLWAAVVPRAQLREIPDEWRGPQYVRPNVSQLAESISRCGILEPLPVVQTGADEYQLVGGSKRMEVVRMLGIEQVPVVVLPGSSAEEARQLYMELRPFTDAAQDTMHNAKFRTAALFGAQRIPEYLL